MNSVELFAGAGGLGLGIEYAGFNHIAVIEKNELAYSTLINNTNWPVVLSEVEEFDYRSIRGRVDLLTGGPPCQPFSFGGKHLAHLDPRDMFPEAIRAVRELKPRAFLFENVKGITREKFFNYFEYVRLQLKHPDIVLKKGEAWCEHLSRLQQHESSGVLSGLHYNVVVQALNAADYGVPQKRERVFIVGFRCDLGLEWSFPEPTHSRDALVWAKWRTADYWEENNIAKKHRPKGGGEQSHALRISTPPLLAPWKTVRNALSDLPDPELHPRLARRYSDHVFIPGARSYKGHTGSLLDEPAKTLKAGVHGVPGGENMLCRPDGSVRYFSVRECSRLQCFPDDFIFQGSWGHTMKQLGNAVPTRLAARLGDSIMNVLKSVK